MFTGIIEEVGLIKNVRRSGNSSRLVIEGNKIFHSIQLGDSVAVNGVCLTVCQLRGNTFEADVMGETLARSSLGTLKAGSTVNLERAMAADGRFGGHIVSGHIDGTGTIEAVLKDDIATWIKVTTVSKVLKFIVEKGSIAIDGVSLTVAKLETDNFEVSLIPHTGKETTLLNKKVGDTVNLENDVIGKYVERLMGLNEQIGVKESGISMKFLMENGF